MCEKINPELAFQFLEVVEGDCCPHCGADGKYIYYWSEFGQVKGAMAGCYKLLTGRIKKSDIENYIESIAVKQAKNKPLNGWDKTVLRMLKYKADNASDSGKVSWADGKIADALREKNQFIAKKFR